MNNDLKNQIIELIVDNATDSFGPSKDTHVESGDGAIYVELEYKYRWSDVVCDVHLISVTNDEIDVVLSDDECYDIQTAANEKIVTPWFS